MITVKQKDNEEVEKRGGETHNYSCCTARIISTAVSTEHVSELRAERVAILYDEDNDVVVKTVRYNSRKTESK
jgi:uncharacterized protein related to proFAR isomerase